MNRPLFLVAAVLLAACASPSRKAGTSARPGAGASAASAAARTGALDAALAAEAAARLSTVRFDYDDARLDEEARAALKANAAWLSAHPAVAVRVDGHCDERGTVAYNLALGQRRADAVRDYYRALGVPESRLTSRSFGKERPDCPDDEEGCHRRNRRAETRPAGTGS